MKEEFLQELYNDAEYIEQRWKEEVLFGLRESERCVTADALSLPDNNVLKP